jgi:hypothetical protein
MLGAFQFQRRQIEDLAALEVKGRLPGQILPARALEQGMDLGVLGRVGELERAAGMAGLAAGLAAGLLAQAFGLGLLGPVGGGRARTVAAGLLHPPPAVSSPSPVVEPDPACGRALPSLVYSKLRTEQ